MKQQENVGVSTDDREVSHTRESGRWGLPSLPCMNPSDSHVHASCPMCLQIYCEELEQILMEACASKICREGWRPRRADDEVPV